MEYCIVFRCPPPLYPSLSGVSKPLFANGAALKVFPLASAAPAARTCLAACLLKEPPPHPHTHTPSCAAILLDETNLLDLLFSEEHIMHVICLKSTGMCNFPTPPLPFHVQPSC